MHRTLAAIVAASAIITCALGGCGDDDEPEGEPLPADVDTILAASASSMGEVTSVRFHLERSGAPVFIDEFESIALEELVGRYKAPASADAVLTVTINDSLSTKLGAVALGGDVWLSNPVTGTFEPLAAGYDIDPAKFFDPVNGWRPLLSGLEDATYVGEEERDGTRYHVRGTAPAARMEAITAGLVEEDVPVDLWVRRDTGIVTAAEFATTFEGETTQWALELSDYGDEFEIEPPDDVSG